jgi:hypothetical protein
MQTILTVTLASNRALAIDVGLIFTFFILMGGVVGILVAYIAFQIRGERQQNREDRAAPRRSAPS